MKYSKMTLMGAIILTFSIVIVLFWFSRQNPIEEVPESQNDTQAKIVSIQNDLQDILGKCDNIISLMNNTELVTRVEELTRENEVLRQEVESQAHQLQLYDGMFKK